jgi:peptidoglycan/xylan/chitin deacetylase (PgdA/CDA1 family)
MPTGSALKNAARAAFHKAGGVGIARWMNRKGLRILMYHRFTEREPLARQCAHIRARYSPVSMSQAADWLMHGGRLPENAAALTVDDGYRDFYQVAYPVLREYGIPATVYLVSDFVDRTLWLWVDQIQYGFLHGEARSFRMEIAGEAPLRFELGTRETRTRAARAVTEAAKKIPNAERLRLLERLPEQLGVRLPEEAPAEYEALRWDDVREMAAAGIEFGAHTRTHPILSRLAGEGEIAGEIASEIEGSKRQIERQVGREVEHFCYPNGSSEDVGREAVEAVRAAGFRTAVMTESGLNYVGADRFRLLRIGMEPGLDDMYFERCAAGFRV